MPKSRPADPAQETNEVSKMKEQLQAIRVKAAEELAPARKTSRLESAARQVPGKKGS